MQTNLDSFDNSWYDTGKSKFYIILWMITSALLFKNSLFIFSNIKVFILRLFGAQIGSNVVLKPSINIKYPWRLLIGNNVWIGEEVWIDNLANVVIMNNVCISQGAMLLTGNHNYTKTSFDLIIGEIVLEEGVWIGAKSVVCPGVTCRSHSILAVNSVATKDLESYKIYQSNPAIFIRERSISE